MDFSVFDPILALRDDLLGHLSDLAAPQDKASAALMKRALQQRERTLDALAASKPKAGAAIKGILRAASAPLPPVGLPERGKKARPRKA